MKPNLIREINNKLVICLPKNNIFFVPHTNKKIDKEMVLRVVLGISEPKEDLSTEQKVKYHKEHNESFIKKYKNQLKDLIYTDISLVDNEVWLIFKEESEEIINYLTKLSEVQIIYHYNQEGGGYDFKNDYHDNFNQDEIIKEITEKLLITSIDPKEKISVEKADSIEVKNVSYNEDNKTITVDLNNYKSEDSVYQLFAYMAAKEDNFQEIVIRLANILAYEIKSKFGDKQICRINFDINAEGWAIGSPNRYVQLIPPDLKNIIFYDTLQQQYLRNESYFNNDELEKEIKDSIVFSLKLYKELFTAIRSKGPDILDLISKLDPSKINVQEIKKIDGIGPILYVKLSIFDTQDKMNILYSYLSHEPYNKLLWFTHIKEIIINAIKNNNLGKLKDYSFITFDSNCTSVGISVKQAAIGGIDLDKNYYDLDNDHEEVKELFYNLNNNFSSDDELDEHIDINIKWNRHTYLSYYHKGSGHIYEYGRRYKREVSFSEINDYFWDTYVDLLTTITETHSISGSNLTITFNGFKDLDDFMILLFLIANDSLNTNNQSWRSKLVSFIKTSLGNSNQSKTIKYVYAKINGDSSAQLLLLDLENLEADYKDNNYDLNNDEDVKNILLINLKRLNPRLTLLAISAGVIPDGLTGCAYGVQYTAVGLSSLFNKIKASAIDFDKKINCIGVLEAESGIINNTELMHFSQDRLLTESSNGKVSNHANLVGIIIGSQKDGVDRTSKIVSAGFKNSTDKDNPIWNALKAIDWLVSKDIKLLNCSWGMPKRRKEDLDFITYSEVAYKLDYISRKFGITVFKSTGNSHRYFKPYFRSASLAFNIICVGSTSVGGYRLSAFSDYEKLDLYKMTKEAPKPLLVAPGEAYFYLNRYYDGTSFATPLVTGTVSVLMKEFSDKLLGKPAGVMAVLAASSNDKYSGHVNVNGLKYETGAGLLDYQYARVAANNLVNTEIECNVDVGHRLYISWEFIVGNKQTVVVSTAGLYNGGYVSSIDLPDQKPTRGGISSVPIIGYLYLTYAYIYNNYQTRKFDEQFVNNKAQLLKLDKSIDVNNLDTYLMPANITATLEVQDRVTKKWSNVEWINDNTSHYSNIKKYEYQNIGEPRRFRYYITVCKEGNYIKGDHTKNVIAFTHIVRDN